MIDAKLNIWRLMKMRRFIIVVIAVVCGITFFGIVLKTGKDLRPLPASLDFAMEDVRKPQIVDRHGNHLTVTYENYWNIHYGAQLHEIPEFLKQAFVAAEDKRFFEHHGVDWAARFKALWQNIAAMEAIRGASTITEQVVKMIHPRPRTLWSRWIEGIEASLLEKDNTKAEILEFYLNQVPYASNRRGVVQAARFYFDRDLETLSKKEMIVLASLIRAPSYLDLRKDRSRVSRIVNRLSDKLFMSGVLSKDEYHGIKKEKIRLTTTREPVFAAPFVQYLFNHISESSVLTNRTIKTTLDGDIQVTVQEIMDRCLKDLRRMEVLNGAALVVDNASNEILAWSVAGYGNDGIPGGFINAVIAPRQPGSAMKPFLYAMALDNGWTVATTIDDSPLVDRVGKGLHEYHNYSRSFYGPVTLRQALGNSLNIPAVRTIKFVGVEKYLHKLHALGFKSLAEHPEFYGDGLALGNGEVSLLELVQAYTVFACKGEFRPLSFLINNPQYSKSERLFPEEIISLIGNILSDPEAREFEFGRGGLLNFPVQTAVKTGTSSDYRDAWALGFNFHYTVGVWMGNLDGSRTNGLTGSRGPAIVLRSIFAELNKLQETRPLYLSPELIRCDVCATGTAQKSESGNCLKRTEWFVRGTEPKPGISRNPERDIKLIQPTPGLQIAMDPRIPDEHEAFAFIIEGIEKDDMVVWKIDASRHIRTHEGRYLWPVSPGRHRLKTEVWKDDRKLMDTEEIIFSVK